LSSQNKDLKLKLEAANKTISDLKSDVNKLQIDLNNAQNKAKRLEQEV
jgi:predicted  nucleic acid-binding Zn-ribbon protein